MRKLSKRSVRKVFRDLGIAPVDKRREAFPMPLNPWPNTEGVRVYRTILSNGTGKALRFDANLLKSGCPSAIDYCALPLGREGLGKFALAGASAEARLEIWMGRG